MLATVLLTEANDDTKEVLVQDPQKRHQTSARADSVLVLWCPNTAQCADTELQIARLGWLPGKPFTSALLLVLRCLMALPSAWYTELFVGQVGFVLTATLHLLGYVGSVFCLSRASSVTFSVGSTALLLAQEVVS